MEPPIPLDRLLSHDEDAVVEWKRNVADVEDVVRKLTAFANNDLANGGWVVCGVEEVRDEHGYAVPRPVGLPAARFKELRGKVPSQCRERVSPALVPSVYEQVVPDDPSRRILIFGVGVSPHAHCFRGRDGAEKYYIVEGSNTIEARGDLLRDLLQRKHALPPLVERPCDEATIEDLNKVAAEQFVKAVGLPLPVDVYLQPDVAVAAIARPLVVSRSTAPGLTRPVPTCLALLLFGQEPTRFVPGAYAVFAVFAGTTRAAPYSDRFDLTGPIPVLIDDLLRRLRLYTGITIDKSGDPLTSRQNRPRFSDSALKEAVVNAFAHRDYESREPIRVTVFDDRIEIDNPGGIARDLDPERLRAGKAPVRWRNHALAGFFLKMNLAQSLGQGIPTIIRETLAVAGREPEFRTWSDGFEVILPAYEPPGATGRRTIGGPPSPEAEPWRPAVDLTIPQRPHWRLATKLGEGGFGETWLAVNDENRDYRVFKFCLEPDKLSALKREIKIPRLQCKLGERNDIARIIDWDFTASPYFIESEYTRAGNLVAWADQQGGISNVPLAVRLEIVAQVATAVAAAHSFGVLHRNVKPANVLIADNGDHVQAQLADFGIGMLMNSERLAEAGITDDGLQEEVGPARAGTGVYMAPEVQRGQPSGPPADVYALGVLLYQMVVGDFSMPVAPGWERTVDDDLLREDLAAALDGSPERRLGDARQLADRLRNLEQRREHREQERRQREAIVRTRMMRARLRRWVAVAAVATVVVAVSVFFAWSMWRQKEEIDRRREAAEAVSNFFVGLFEIAEPDEALADRMTVRQLLDRGGNEVETALSEQPEIQARLMHALGEAYRNLGSYGESARLVGKAVETRRMIHGENHADLAESLNLLAEVRLAQGDDEEAEELANEAWDIRRRLFGNQHPAVADTMETLANVRISMGDYETAEKLQREVLAMRRLLFDAQHPDIAVGLDNLAWIHFSRDEFYEAESLFREALDMRLDLFGPEHRHVATSLSNLGQCLEMKGDLKEAGEHYQEALHISRKMLGDEHPDLAISLNNLAGWLEQKRDFDKAEEHYCEALELRRRMLGDDHRFVGNSYYRLGGLRESRGDFQGAALLYGRAFEIFRRTLSPDHPDRAAVLDALALMQESSGDLEGAEPESPLLPPCRCFPVDAADTAAAGSPGS